MNGLVSFLIAGANQARFRLGLWLVCFVLLVSGSGWFILRELDLAMTAEVQRVLEPYTRIRAAVLGTFGTMERELTAAPCSVDYAAQQRRVAFLPDGMNELFFFDNGSVICTANHGLLPKPIALGPPDLASDNPFGVSFWFNRDLAQVGLDGLNGNFAVRGHDGMVVPITPLAPTTSKWMQFEVVVRAPDQRWWHASGEAGLYAAAIAEPNGAFGLRDGALTAIACDPAGLHCLAGRAGVDQLFVLGAATIALTLFVCGVLAAWAAGHICGALARHWSFDSRFLRRFQGQGMTCAYQPLLDLRSGLVTGCEVLARWRDVDGTTVYPDRFIPLVEARGLTLDFTRIVVAAAHRDLVPLVPMGQRLQVNFNIFPQDLEAEKLIGVFAPFLAPTAPFDLVIEIVETGELDLEKAQVEIERLRAAGAQVYIDDFGAGYSSMHTLAGLSVDGVKLDRSFAMASEDSVMSRMLDHAIELVQDPNRKVVVEGVETAARLAQLTESGKVHFAQGYHIARPLDAYGFSSFLAERGPRPQSRPRLVA